MRVGYTDEEDYQGQFDLWHANCRRSINGRKGQKALRELEQALLAMPDKRIYPDILVAPNGAVCAIGSLMVQKKIDAGMSRKEAVAVCAQTYPEETEDAGVEVGIPRMVAWSIAIENDNDWRVRTPKELYTHMLNWVQERIKP